MSDIPTTTDFKRPTKEMVERFRKCYVAAISDAMDNLGVLNCIVPASVIKPLIPGTKIAGTAITMKVASARTIGPVPHRLSSVFDGEAGDIPVIDNGGRLRIVAWGGGLTGRAIKKGLEGMILDGCTRDAADIIGQGFPMWVRGVSPQTSRKRTETIAINQPIEIAPDVGGVQVRAGDIIVADDDGIAVIPLDRAEEVLVEAERIVNREAQRDVATATGAAV